VPEKAELQQIADKHGVSIAVAREDKELEAVNNNSICRTLNPDGVYVEKCAAFCGTVSDEVRETNGRVAFTCHAGLECRGLPIEENKVAIVGRVFVDREAYRQATERALSGDWKDKSPVDLFENVLFASSPAQIDAAAQAVDGSISGEQETATPLERKPEPPVKQERPSVSQIAKPPLETRSPTVDPSAWRSFFGSILDSGYTDAVREILEFLGVEFELDGIAWLERVDDSFRSSWAVGELSGKKVRLGIAANDRRLKQAAFNSEPLELGESTGGRRLTLFPVTIGTEVPAAIATLDDVEETRHEIMNVARRIAPQLEILRLRREVERREKVGHALDQFSSGIKDIDSDDLWLRLTQTAAEIMQAERSSILVYDERVDQFEIKSIIGSRNKFDREIDIGSRVGRVVLNRERPVVVGDVAKTRLPVLAEDRHYRSPSFISCPIRIGTRPIGVMSFTDRACGKPFDKDSLELFEAIAPQLAVAVDRARLKEKAGEFEQLSVTDALTGLLNRRYMEQRLTEEVKRSNRHGFPMSFLMLDVDHFKSYNDEFGHPAGDEALKLVGSVIKDTLRAADVAARFGGEEFAILLPQTMADESAVIAERIRHNIEATQFPHRRVTLSIGIASCSADLCISENIVAAADKALYEAKRQGRNQVRAFEEIVTAAR
jgi:diguanylate cyclase (GGDEF)-like protein